MHGVPPPAALEPIVTSRGTPREAPALSNVTEASGNTEAPTAPPAPMRASPIYVRNRQLDGTTFLAGMVLTLALGVAALALFALVHAPQAPETPPPALLVAPTQPAQPWALPDPAPAAPVPSSVPKAEVKAAPEAPARPTRPEPAAISGTSTAPGATGPEPSRAEAQAAPVDPPPAPVAADEPAPEPAVADAAAPAPPVAPAPVAPPPEPAFDPSPFAGRWTGSRSGRPLILELTLAADGSVKGSTSVTVGPKKLTSPVLGTWRATGDGLQVDATQTQGERPERYVGVLGGGSGEGTWSEGGRERGQWSVAR